MSASFDKSSGSNRNVLLLGGGCLLAFICLCVAAIVGILLVPDATMRQLAQLLGFQSSATAIDYVPADAPMYVDINPNFSQLSGFQKLQKAFDARPEFRKRIEELVKESSGQGKQSDFSVERDILPWIGGDAGIAVLEAPPASGSGLSDRPAKFVLLASTRNTKESDAALARLRKTQESAGYTFTEEAYKSATLTIGTKNAGRPGSAGDTFAYTTFQGQVMLGADAASLKKAIDTKDAGEKASLKNKDAYKALLNKLPKDRAVTFVVDPKALIKTASDLPGTAASLKELEAYTGIAFAVSFVEDGIRLDGVSAYDAAKTSKAFQTFSGAMGANANRAQGGMPANSAASFTGMNLKAIYDYYYDIASRDAATKRQLDSALAEFKDSTGLDANEDILGWMTGEFAFGVVPAKAIAVAGPNAPAVGVQLMFEAKDEALVRGKMTKLTGILAQQGLQFASKKVNGVDMQVVKGLEQQGLTVGYGFVEGFLVIGSAEEVLAGAVDARKTPLTGNTEYIAATKYLPAPNSGISFINIGSVLDLVRGSLARAEQTRFDAEVAPLAKPFKSVGFSGTPVKDGFQNTVIFIHIAE